jgi:hypothetical protein
VIGPALSLFFSDIARVKRCIQQGFCSTLVLLNCRTEMEIWMDDLGSLAQREN